MHSATSVLSRKISSFIRLTEAEESCLASLQSTPIHVKRGKELFHEGQSRQAAYILQSGWACSFKLLPDGGRQIITFPVPGDCIGLRSILLRTSDHSFSALTDATFFRAEAAQIRRTFEDFPHLGAALLWATSRDEAMVVEHLVSIGRRSAIARTSHFFLELYDRLKLVGLTIDHEFKCPLNQNVLSDAIGLSTIHVNRILRQLRERNLMTYQNHKVTIHNPAALKALAGYENPDGDPIILYDNRRARDNRD